VARYDFMIETYETERLKTLSVWSQIAPADLEFRCEARARTPREQMVHQCVSEDFWMRAMLDVATPGPVLPEREGKLDFIEHYAAQSSARLAILRRREESWFEGTTTFFAESRSRAWVLLRRIAHSAHHRGQLTAFLRARGQALYSTYGPTADTGGLFQNEAPVIYRHRDLDDLLAEARGGRSAAPSLPGPGGKPPTERPVIG
jgi:uncharacterized damage-inducible protein DinB